MTDEQAEQLLAEVATLRAELQVQKDLVAALLKKLYGAKSEKLDTDQLLMAFLEDEAKKHAAAGPEEGPAAESKPSNNKRQPRQSRLAASLQSLPAIERIVTDPKVLADPDAYRLLGEEISERLRVNPATFTREVIRRQTHVHKNDRDNQPLTPPLEPCLLPGSVLSPSLGAYLGKLFKHLQLKRRILPKSKLGKALNYALDQWKQLEPCFHDGQIEFDNNHTENAIRPTKLGAKNWLFIGRDETGWRSAIIYTMVEQVRRHGRDPFAYLEWVFEKLMHNPAEEDLPSLLPTSWLEAQDASEFLPQNAA